jgi:hypothetical protein
MVGARSLGTGLCKRERATFDCFDIFNPSACEIHSQVLSGVENALLLWPKAAIHQLFSKQRESGIHSPFQSPDIISRQVLHTNILFLASTSTPHTLSTFPIFLQLTISTRDEHIK